MLGWVGAAARPPPPTTNTTAVKDDDETKKVIRFDPLFALQPPGAERIPRWNSSLDHFQKTMFIFSVTVSSGLTRNSPILFRFARRDTAVK